MRNAAITKRPLDEGHEDRPTESQLADWFHEQLEDGALLLEDIPLRLARYGAMDPAQFRAEMRERMEQYYV